MGVAVVLLEAQWPPLKTDADVAVLLFVCVGSAASIYLTSLWLLWLAAGVDDDPEPEAMRLAREFLSKRSTTIGPSDI
jgi:hypothetical protein